MNKADNNKEPFAVSPRDHLDSKILEIIGRAKKETWLFVKNLKPEDRIEVQTHNTLYTMIVVNPEKEMVRVTSNGKYFKTETDCAVIGSNPNGRGTMVIVGGISLDVPLILWSKDLSEIILSPTKEVWVNGERVLYPKEQLN